MGFWAGVAGIVATAGSIMRGKTAVQDIVDLKVGRAKRRINDLVSEIIATQNRDLMGAVLDEFGNQLQSAETREFQDEVNDLLWYFKETFMERANFGSKD